MYSGMKSCSVHIDRILSEAEYQRIFAQRLKTKRPATVKPVAHDLYKRLEVFYSRNGMRTSLIIPCIPEVKLIEHALQAMFLAVTQEGDIK